MYQEYLDEGFVLNEGGGAGGSQQAAGANKATTFLVPDGWGIRAVNFTPLLIATTDVIPGNTSSTATLTVGAAHTISTIDTVGDMDFYRVTLTAGTSYQIGMYGYTGGPGLLPLSDSYVEVYDAAGNLIASGDGGADTPANAVNSGFDVLMTFNPTVTGTYYINARAFDNVPADGSNGDLVGDYELFVQLTPPGGYQPYYEPDSPLYAIDWGTQVNKINGTARNPDGDEGIRSTGNAQGTPTYTSVVDIPALAAAQGVNITGKNVITIYFAQAGDIFVSNDLTNPGLPPATITATGVQQFEHDSVMTALAQFSKVADVVYLEVSDRNAADFIYTSYAGTPGPGVSLLGSMSPPDESDEGLAQFNSGDYRWNATDLQQGGFSYVTLIHEFGHGHGLAHPHDNGGHSGVMNGVEAEGAGVADYTTGDFALNQGVFTMMSYEDGWQSSPYGNAPTNVGYGYLGGLMAFDIAAIQDKYGVNEDWATGNDLYELKDVNAPGTFFTSIWDAGGVDEIRYTGTRNTVIDLRAATLQYEAGGGGRVSYATGIFGGYTIANSVVIENATTGSGADTLIGNSAANILNGGAGADAMTGGAGDDIYYVDDAGDVVTELSGEGFDEVRTTLSNYVMAANVEKVTLLNAGTARGTSANDSLVGSSAGDLFLLGDGGNDTASGGDGDDGFIFGAALTAADQVDGGNGSLDQVGIQGDYSGGLTLGAGNLVNVEFLVFLAGNDTRFGDNAGNFYDYNITTVDENVAANQRLVVSFNRLRVGEDVTFNGSAETDGYFLTYGGAGNDNITGGAKDDGFFFGLGTFGSGDVINGGAGNLDQIGLQGDFNGANAVTFGANQLVNVEIVVLVAGSDTRFGGGGAVTYDYDLTMNDGNVGTGGRLVVSANRLAAGETLTLNAAAEADGTYWVYAGAGADVVRTGGGADQIYGQGGDDRLTGGGGADQLWGGTGNDVFAYLSVTDSTTGARDRIMDFAAGDRIDLSGSGTSFVFIGTGEFGGGSELRVYDDGLGTWYVDGDSDGDFVADFSIQVTADANYAWSSGDFIL